MRYLLCILVFCTALVKAQDKLFFNDGSIKTGIIVSMARDVVYFKLSDTSATTPIKKSELIMAENYKGTRYVFGKEAAMTGDRPSKSGIQPVKYQNSIGVMPLGLFLGRATLSYERLSADGSIGLAIPVSLTFNPYNSGRIDSFTVMRRKGVNAIGGIDLNFYFGKTEKSKFYLGPRVRYGTDVLVFNTQFYTIQTHMGWKFENAETRFVQHFSIGFGFLKPISSSGIVVDGRTFACYSLNYRLGVKW